MLGHRLAAMGRSIGAMAIVAIVCPAEAFSQDDERGATLDGSAGWGGRPSDGGPVGCANPGKVTDGPADAHCAAAARVAGTEGDCPYGDTRYGAQADDDDCKYHVRWTAGPICDGPSGVPVTLTVTQKADGTPLGGTASTIVMAEVFRTTPLDAGIGGAEYCDDLSTHPTPEVEFRPGAAGTWTGTLVFDEPGQWTVRFHVHEECLGSVPDSPYGHAAFHVTVN